jgi:HlyD family secretion protein
MANKTKKRSWKWVVLIVGVIVLAAVGLWYVKMRRDSAPQYQTASVALGDVTQLVTATGQLNPVTNVQVGCQISGTIAKLYADWNSPVTNGQLVAQIDPATYLANLHQAEGDLANSQAALELTKVNAVRAQELYESKLIPHSDYDQAMANLHQAAATIQMKQASLEKSQVDLAYCTIYSPVDGMVISRNVDVGQTVAASFNAPVLFVIANDLTKMQIDANVAEADVGGVEVAQNVDFTVDAFPNHTFHGKVVQVRSSPLTVQNVVTYDTVIAVNNPDLKLKPGMTANVSVIVAEHTGVLRVPNSALRFHPPETGPSTNGPPRMGGGGSYPGSAPGSRPKGEHRPARSVYVLKDDKPQPVQVKLGITDGIYTEVTDGLGETDMVITSAIYKQGSGSGQASSPFGPRRF